MRYLLVIMLMLSGCATKPIPVVYDCPVIMLPADPIPDIRKLKPDARPDQIIKAWVATATQYRGWDQTVRAEIANSK